MVHQGSVPFERSPSTAHVPWPQSPAGTHTAPYGLTPAELILTYPHDKVIDASAVLLDQCRSNIIMVFVAPLLVSSQSLLIPLGFCAMLPEDERVVHVPFNYKYYWK